MDTITERNTVLDALVAPAFLVRCGSIVQVNHAAAGLMIQPGTPISQLLHTGIREFGEFSQGRMYLTLALDGTLRSATVTKLNDDDLFQLERDEQRELTPLSLGAMQLREPLTKALISAERLYSPESGKDALRLNRGLYQMLRILGNMADAAEPSFHPETVDISGAIGEIFEKASALLEHAGKCLRYTGPQEPVYGLADSQQLERAILNILSNAAKYSPAGSCIDAVLSRRDQMLQLTIRDAGCGIGQELLPTVFNRYLREPGIEDPRSGLGLGMVLIKSAAESHGGTVLIDTPDDGGTRITLTLSILQRKDDILRSPVMIVDRYGERDHALIELSDVLPPELYDLSK